MPQLLFLVSLLVSPLLFATNNDIIQTVTFAYDVKPNPPYYYGEGTSIDWNKPGLALDELNQVAKSLGIKINFVRRPWARALTELRNNSVDGVFHASYKPEREEIGVYPKKNGKVDQSRKAMTQGYYYYTRKDSKIAWNGKTLDNFEGSVGAIIGYSIVKDMQALGLDVQQVATQKVNLLKLAKGRIDLVAGIGAMNDFQIQKHPELFNEIVKLQPAIKQKHYYLIFSHAFAQKHKPIMEQIWNELIIFQNSGEHTAMLEKYLY